MCGTLKPGAADLSFSKSKHKALCVQSPEPEVMKQKLIFFISSSFFACAISEIFQYHGPMWESQSDPI